MALYAYEEEILIYAAHAEERRSYRCSDCQKWVKVRKGPRRVPHFYHVARSPACRLYHKSQDHLLVQLAIQKLLPPGETILEKPFADILRIADVAWEPYKIAFEIQCSLLSEKEARQRVCDYARVGYRVVWILDDRIFNRKILRPAEHWIRTRLSYYATLRKVSTPVFYDQFEVFQGKKRIKRGIQLNVRLQQPSPFPPISWPEEKLPRQIIQKASMTELFFQGDLLHKAILSMAIPSLAISMENLRFQERFYSLEEKKENPIKKWAKWALLQPFSLLLLYLLKKGSMR